MSVRWRGEKSRRQTAAAAAVAWLEGTAGSRSRSSHPHLVRPDNRPVRWVFPRLHSPHLSAAKQQVLLIKLQVSGSIRETAICIHDDGAYNITTIKSLQLSQKPPSEGSCHASILEDWELAEKLIACADS